MTNKRHANISIFIPHLGCPNTCSFCNQHTISHTVSVPKAKQVEATLEKAFLQIDIDNHKNTEIAFFGGSFTAIDRAYMIELLETASRYIFCENGFSGIRISTRPDCIDEEILMLLKKYGVKSIELGAQSMSDNVLALNKRGHKASDVVNASKLIKKHGFELGLQMMVGLYGSTVDDENMTMHKIAECNPKTVRIYPTVVIDGTHLATLYKNGEYELMPFEECVKLCADMVIFFHEKDIRVIRLGLHAEDDVEKNAVAGYYHPAFSQIVRSEIFKRAILFYCNNHSVDKLKFRVNTKNTSCLLGHSKSNRIMLEKMGISYSFVNDNSLSEDEISINEEVYNVFKITGNAWL